MLKKLINECRFMLTLHPKSPLLIKEGRYNSLEIAKESGHPDSFFVCRNTQNEIEKAVKEKDYSKISFYLPGSSLRGIMRSHAEKIVRTLIPDDPVCCEPGNGTSCKGAYKYSCVICKLFGSLELAGRIQIHDSDTEEIGSEIERHGIAIDRFTGGVSEKEKSDGGKSGMLFTNILLKDYVFTSQITIRNFERWQLGLLAYVLRDFHVFSNSDEPGLITIGYGKNRGLGRVSGKVGDVNVTYYDRNLEKKSYELMGLAEMEPESAETYGFITGNQEQVKKDLLEEAVVDIDTPYKKQCKVKDNVPFFKTCAGVWNETISNKKFHTLSALKERNKQKNDV